MRLSEFELECIKRMAIRHFGADVQVFLYGSRTSNQKRGGDIDLLISNPDEEQLSMRKKIDFLTDLILLIGEQKIDVVLDNKYTKKSLFLKSIFQTGIQLC
jgi:predicted nucleotidyltransferase